MVEEVSPIIYKKIDLSKFNRESERLYQSNSSKNNSNYTGFYDSTSKKLIQVSETGIRIFNKSGTNLKKDIRLQLNKEKIYKISVDKQIRYMLIFIDNRQEKGILIVSIENANVIKIIAGDGMNLKGMFFIYNTQTLTISRNVDVKFALIYTDKINYFKISNYNVNYIENIELIEEVRYGRNNQNSIKKFLYNTRYMILCVQKEIENEFDFYNLSNTRFYDRAFPFVLPDKDGNVPKKGMFSTLLSYFQYQPQGGDSENLNEPILNTKDNYRNNHCFLEEIYDKFYFIFLNYNEACIQLFRIKSLYEIIKVTEIQFDKENICTLQFIDNLILLHNIDKSETMIIDLRSESEDKIGFKYFPMSSFDLIKENKQRGEKMISIKVNNTEINEGEDYKCGINIHYNYIETISMLTYTNTMFYGKNIRINGGIIEENESNGSTVLYDIYFDPLIYYDNSPTKFEAGLNGTRRKNGKQIIIHGLYEMIKSTKNLHGIKGVFSRIVDQIVENRGKNVTTNLNPNTNKIEISKEKESKTTTGISKIEEYRLPQELPIPFGYNLGKKKTIVVQTDIYHKLGNPFEFKYSIKPEYLIQVLIQFSNECRKQCVKLHPEFFKVLITFLRKISNGTQEEILFQFHSIPDNKELAVFLGNDIAQNEMKYYNKKTKQGMTQIGIDMLVRLREYQIVFCLMVKLKKVKAAVLLLQKFTIKKEKIPEETMNEFKRGVSTNISLVNSLIEVNSLII